LIELADLKKKSKNDEIIKKPHQIINKHRKTKQKYILNLSYFVLFDEG
jgi:ApbE superfamily uncharacterized protein (UPF0280 family)